jgi:hypothetical protein
MEGRIGAVLCICSEESKGGIGTVECLVLCFMGKMLEAGE